MCSGEVAMRMLSSETLCAVLAWDNLEASPPEVWIPSLPTHSPTAGVWYPLGIYPWGGVSVCGQ